MPYRKNKGNKRLARVSLGLFMTQGLSLADWERVGLLSREVEPYNCLADYFKRIYIFTYGDERDLVYHRYLKDNIQIIFKKQPISDSLYSILLPFFERKIIKKCTFLKTNQMRGASSAIISKIFNPRKILLIRTGYSLTYSYNRRKKYFSFIWFRFFERMAYLICNVWLVSSQGLFQYMNKNSLNYRKKIIVIPNYINTEIFSPDEGDKYNNRIIYIGALRKVKNIKNLIKALGNSNITLDIVGSGPLKNELKTLAKQHRIKCSFLGKIPNHELPEVLNKYQIFVLPSLSEWMPKSLLEAMSCGLACIGTNVIGINELIKDRETGILCETNPKSIRQAILGLIYNHELIIKLGKNAREYVVNNFSLYEEIKKEIAVYKNLIKPGKK